MVRLLMPSAAVWNVATLPPSATVVSTVVPSLNVTVPVGVPEPGAVAVTVAGERHRRAEARRAAEVVSATEAEDEFTVWLERRGCAAVVVDVAGVGDADRVRADRQCRQRQACLARAVEVVGGRLVPSTTNVTEPAGVPPPGATAATVAVNVTDWPKTVGDAGERGNGRRRVGWAQTVCATGPAAAEEVDVAAVRDGDRVRPRGQRGRRQGRNAAGEGDDDLLRAVDREGDVALSACRSPARPPSPSPSPPPRRSATCSGC